jgi:hypothetical protein
LSGQDTEPLDPELAAQSADPLDERGATAPPLHDPEELPPRPRRRLLTPVTGGLLGLLLAGCGFLAGVLIEKGQADTAGAGGFAGRAGGGTFGARSAAGQRGAPGAASSFGGQSGAGATTGQVSTVRGRTLYVQGDQGNTVKVTLATGANVSRTTSSSAKAIHPGDSVVVQGQQRGDGSVDASSVRATAANLAGAAAVGQLFGGGASGGAGAQSGGTGVGAAGAGGRSGSPGAGG